jgi:hypothetical protein
MSLVSEQTTSSGPLTGPDGADRRLVYLTGSHIWNNLQDHVGPAGGGAETPEQLDYRAYLQFLKEHGHNFIRLWRWEHFKSQAFSMAPQAWPRTGPGTAKDGKVTVESDERARFTAPFAQAGPAVLYLKQVRR